MANKTISVMLCVNDPANGNWCGRLAGVDIFDVVRLEPRVLPEPRCSIHVGEKVFKIHRKRFSFISHSTWVGNWCWDAIEVNPMAAARLIETLLAQRCGDEQIPVWGFDEAQGESMIELMLRHDERKPITADQIFRSLMRDGWNDDASKGLGRPKLIDGALHTPICMADLSQYDPTINKPPTDAGE